MTAPLQRICIVLCLAALAGPTAAEPPGRGVDRLRLETAPGSGATRPGDAARPALEQDLRETRRRLDRAGPGTGAERAELRRLERRLERDRGDGPPQVIDDRPNRTRLLDLSPPVTDLGLDDLDGG
jgi:hypothetical protein